MASELVGRDPEIAVVESLLAGIGDGGGSLLVLGDPGSGSRRWRRWPAGVRPIAGCGC
jgi:hypothetical protein